MIQCFLQKDSKKDLNVAVFNTVSAVPATDWTKVLNGKNVYLSLFYLEAIEKSLVHEMAFRYLVFYNENSVPVAIAAVQFLTFVDKEYQEREQLCMVRNQIKNHLVDSTGVKVMTCGSPFSCGENGFLYDNEISEKEAYKNLSKALIQLQKNEKNTLNSSVILLKDFWPSSDSASKILKSDSFREFMIDVNMVMKIDATWKSREDYLQSMVTKFRTKAKSALKKSEQVKKINFQEADIVGYQKEIDALYLAVVEKSDFTFGSLNAETFVCLKRNLKDKFLIQGYFINDQMVGFSSAFICDGVMDANYVGIDYTLNKEYAIYQRMLYDYVSLAIETNCTELRFGRTAEEIKSTVGALPVNMKLFARHRNSVKNSLLKPIVNSISPSSFEQRYPFKAEFYKA
jgi:hypothetical protein